ncbi:MAG: LytR C-terminal domain-containing protein [Longimicrobiales bacterium]|jgi:hypothetical protein|nr:LytR C-terminal domain-containing protein [Longimicrobiales bacterium]|tara:strand:- start:738 stop:1232 length:495 start_codon:yes stop_codon:yes gene_type:complete
MSEKLRSLLLFVMILVVGIFLGSMVDQWELVEEIPIENTAIQNLPNPELGRVRVEVLNGGGVPGMASVATDYLRELGFDVVNYGNASSFDQDSTIVIDRSGQRDLADAVAEALGAKVREDTMDTDPYLDVTVILGKSWAPNPEKESFIRGVAGLPWWDIKKYLR